MLDKLAGQITNEIGEEDGILILDPTSFPKKALEMIAGRGKMLPHKWIAGDDEMGRVPLYEILEKNHHTPDYINIKSI